MNKCRNCTLSENEIELQKTEQVPVPFPRAPRNFPDVKTSNGEKFDNWNDLMGLSPMSN
jgi:hypothetical protein